MEIKLPSRLHDFTVQEVITEMEKKQIDDEVVVNLSELRVAYPIGTLAFAQYLKYNAMNRDRKIRFVSTNVHTAAIGYLTSVGFFKYFGEDPFKATDLRINKTYIPVSIINWSDLKSRVNDDEKTFGTKKLIQDIIEEYSDNYSAWMFNKIEPVISYCFREIIRNVFEHTNALYCSIFGQIYNQRNEIEICIADSGCGIRNSLSKKYIECTDDEWALSHAILPGITSESIKNSGMYDNSGFGLYVLSEIAKKFGYMVIASGEKLIRITGNDVKLHDYQYLGTMVGINFKYNELLKNKNIILDLIKEGESLSQKMDINGKASTSTKKI